MTQSECVAFVKDPEKDPVKTRLAREVGHSMAVEIYKACLRVLGEQLLHLRECGVQPVVATPDGLLTRSLSSMLGDLPVVGQGAGNIGHRMLHIDQARRQRHQLHSGTEPLNIAYIGSDAPSLPPSIILNCLRRADPSTAVIAPAEDGGFTALAAGFPLPNLTGIRWSRAQTFSDTSAALAVHGYRVLQEQLWYDIDTTPDLVKLARSFRARRDLSSHEALLLQLSEEGICKTCAQG